MALVIRLSGKRSQGVNMDALTAIPDLTRAHWPPDRSEPVLDRSIGDALRDAAAVWPERIALIEGLSPERPLASPRA